MVRIPKIHVVMDSSDSTTLCGKHMDHSTKEFSEYPFNNCCAQCAKVIESRVPKTHKVCTKCDINKNADQFARTSTANGLSSQCKSCTNERQKQNYNGRTHLVLNEGDNIPLCNQSLKNARMVVWHTEYNGVICDNCRRVAGSINSGSPPSWRRIHIVLDVLDNMTLCGRSIGNFGVETINNYPFDNCCKHCDSIVMSYSAYISRSKICIRCGIDKSLRMFGHNQNTHDGYTLRCTECSDDIRRLLSSEHTIDNGTDVIRVLACLECEELKPDTEFYTHIKTVRGFSGKCKSCIKHERSQYWDDNDDVYSIIGETTTKECPSCRIIKFVTEYHIDRSNKNGLSPRCKQCVNKENDERRKTNVARGKSKVPSHKVCLICNIEKPSSKFHANHGANDGLDSRCKSCASELKKKYNQDNPHVMLNASAKRRILLEEQQGIVTPEKVNGIRNAEYCYYCGINFSDSFKPEVEHYMPLALGGMHDDSNLVPACGPCNDSKGSKHPDDFLRLLE